MKIFSGETYGVLMRGNLEFLEFCLSKNSGKLVFFILIGGVINVHHSERLSPFHASTFSSNTSTHLVRYGVGQPSLFDTDSVRRKPKFDEFASVVIC